MRIMALDYGARTVGVAVTDPLGLTVQGVETVRREHEDKLRQTLARITTLIGEFGVGEIVVGLPLNMDGSEGERALKSRAFAEKVAKRTGLPVYLQDERLTSVEADERMREAGLSAKERKKIIDMVAAQVILEDHLASPAKSGPAGT